MLKDQFYTVDTKAGHTYTVSDADIGFVWVLKQEVGPVSLPGYSETD